MIICYTNIQNDFTIVSDALLGCGATNMLYTSFQSYQTKPPQVQGLI